MKSYITNKKWQEIYEQFEKAATYNNGYIEDLGASFMFDPVTDYKMTDNVHLFDTKKAAAMYFWYKKADKFDMSIINSFEEYKKCIYNDKGYFNSNYGIYAYEQGGLDFCINELKKDHKSRRACFLINSNEVSMKDFEIDKLCTNAIQFFIRDAKLHMVVQMRSSNFLTLLPYDAFMFSVFYYQVFKALQEHYKILMTGKILMQIASLHYYSTNRTDIIYRNVDKPKDDIELIDYNKNIDFTEQQLKKYLK